ncbi:hypothetical protein Gotur_024983, partial [Gossypium turneri]
MHGHLHLVFFQVGILWEMIQGSGDSDGHSNENEGSPPNEVPSNPSHETPNQRKQTLGVMDEFNNMYNSFDMNYDTLELSEEAQRRIAIMVTQ